MTRLNSLQLLTGLRGGRTALAAAVAVALATNLASAQTPTGTLGGRVTDTTGAGLPGVTVTLTSPALQGSETTVTTPVGDYLFKLLPPGSYLAEFRLPGFAGARHTRVVSATESVVVDVVLAPARIQESVLVTSDASAFVGTLEGATSVKQTVLDALPTNRSMLAAVGLAPSVHATGPDNSVMIAGAMSFESLYLVNGVPVQENLRGQPLSLFIEDAIQETTISTSAVPASRGRFSGGVVNTITKSGGNDLSGTFRTRVANDNWRSVSPFGESKTDRTVPTYEATVGGPLQRDRLWFFAAVRSTDNTVSRETGFTNISYDRQQTERRGELKLTQSLGRGQRVTANYLRIAQRTVNSAWPSTSQVMDLASLTNPRNPQTLAGVHYAGTFRTRLFVQAQVSARKLAFEESGGTATDLINGTPLRDQQTGAWWWSPNFCAVCPPEERNNTNVTVTASYFLSTRSGAHDIEVGYDGFNDKTLVENHQSGSDYHVWATSSTIQNGVVYPVIEPGFSTFIIHWPVRPSSQGANFRTHSLFAQDRWSVNRFLSVGLGLRYDRNDGRDSSGARVSDDQAVSPRVGLTWDPNGLGRTSVSASFGRYVTGLNNGVAGSASPAGTPAIYGYFYDGAPINTGSGPLVRSDAALAGVFAWFNGARPDPFFVDIPGVSTRIAGSLKSPSADEWTVGVSREVGRRATVRLDIVDRQFRDFYAERVDRSTGLVQDDLGQTFDLTLIENTNALSRRYRALNAQAGYRGTALTLGGSYTLSQLSGNVDGENSGTGPLASGILSYPEYLDARWFAPVGDLAADQRHRARLWATYLLTWGQHTTVTIGAIQSVESGTPYGASSSIVISPFVQNPGYALPPDLRNYFFTSRDQFRTETSRFTDVSVQLDRALPTARRARVFVQAQLLNAFNEFQIADADEINTTVVTAVDSGSLQTFDPFTTTPVEGVHWRKDAAFGQPVSRNAYTAPRVFRFSVGVKF